MQRARDTLPATPWWGGGGVRAEDDIEVAMHTLERGLLTHLYPYTFSVSEEDERMQEEMKKRAKTITYRHMYINERFRNQVPWVLAQHELQRINVYKSPQDKMKCIAYTWNIIFNYLKPLGEVGPDDFLPIMGFVILKSRVQHLLSNLNYIERYTILDAMSEVLFIHMKSAVEVLREVIETDYSHQGWQKGVVLQTQQRMTTLMKTIKKKEKKEFKRRTSIFAKFAAES